MHFKWIVLHCVAHGPPPIGPSPHKGEYLPVTVDHSDHKFPIPTSEVSQRVIPLQVNFFRNTTY